MLNPRPPVISINNVEPGYTKAYITHSFVTPEASLDLVGRRYEYWETADKAGTEAALEVPNYLDANVVLSNLSTATLHTVRAGYYDQLSNQSLRDNGVTVDYSTNSSFTTLIEPDISTVSNTASAVDVGTAPSYVTMTLTGEATDVIVYAEKVGSGEGYKIVYNGPFQASIDIFDLPLGNHNFKVVGLARFSNGVVDLSAESSVKSLVVEQISVAPDDPSNLTFENLLVSGGVSKYSLKVRWDWDKGTGGSLRNFILEYRPVSGAYVGDGNTGVDWSDASVETASSEINEVILPDFPQGVQYAFRLRTNSWGDASDNTKYSNWIYGTYTASAANSTFYKDSRMVIDDTGIVAYNLDQTNAGKDEVFRLDATTGNVNIGIVTPEGNVPISLNGTTGTVEVSGEVISNKITAASVELGWLGGIAPSISSTNKTGYADANSGFWLGYTTSDANTGFKLDLGNTTQYLRWDGQNLVISGKVIVRDPTSTSPDIGLEDIVAGAVPGPKGDTTELWFTRSQTDIAGQHPTNSISEEPEGPNGLVWSKDSGSIPEANGELYITTGQREGSGLVVQYDGVNYWTQATVVSGAAGSAGNETVNFFIRSSTTPSYSPSNPANPGTGWVLDPSATVGSNPLYISSGRMDANRTSLVSGATWTAPVRLTGEKGDTVIGADGSYREFIFKYDTVKPTAFRTVNSIPPSGWSTDSGSLTKPSANHMLYMATGVVSGETGNLVPNGANYWTEATEISGENGADGAEGIYLDTVFQWTTNANTAPTLPSSATSLGSWSSVYGAQPSTSHVLWSTSAWIDPTTGDFDGTKSTQWETAVRRTALDGADGIDGFSNTVLTLYKRTTGATPTKPTQSLIYSFNLDNLSGDLEGWSRSVPTTGGDYTWATTAPVSISSGNTATVAPATWATPSQISQYGTRAGIIYLYIRTTTDSRPALPSGTLTYNFDSASITTSAGDAAFNGWSTVPPAKAGTDKFLWVTAASASASSSATTDSILSSEWITAEILAEDGDKGDKGDTGSPGTDGTDGAGWYSYDRGSSSVTGTDANYTSWFTTASGRPPVLSDVLIVNNSTPQTNSVRYNGSTWTSATLYVDGDTIINGTLSALAFQANTALISALETDIIYNTGGSASNYTMKIDLGNGSIHIK